MPVARPPQPRLVARMHRSPARIRHDVLIVGGGLVGASLAIALERIGVDVGAGRGRAGRRACRAVFDERNLSFAEATRQRADGAGRAAEAARAGRRDRTHPRQSPRRLRPRACWMPATTVASAFGRVVVARDFGEALEARLAELPRADALSAGAFRRHGAGRRRRSRRARRRDGDGERELHGARLLVAADGTRSGVRDALGIGVDEHDYGQTLFVARVRAERAPDGTAYERFGEQGPTALLPRGDRHYGADPCASPRDAGRRRRRARRRRLPRAPAGSASAGASGRLLVVRRAQRLSDRSACVARRTHRARARCWWAMPRRRIHPIGAQGFNLGLRDALTLAELIDGARRRSGAMRALLAAYARASRARIANARWHSPTAWRA